MFLRPGTVLILSLSGLLFNFLCALRQQHSKHSRIAFEEGWERCAAVRNEPERGSEETAARLQRDAIRHQLLQQRRFVKLVLYMLGRYHHCFWVY